jgi:hypothetical protein
VPDEIGPRAEHLSELDERRSEFGERQPQAYRCGEIDDVLARRSAQPPLNAFARDLPQPVGESVTHGDGDDFPEAPRVAIAPGPPCPAIAQGE